MDNVMNNGMDNVMVHQWRAAARKQATKENNELKRSDPIDPDQAPRNQEGNLQSIT